MASGGDDALRVVEVKHGKDRHEIAVDDGSITTARDLMDRLLDITGVLQKNQKLLGEREGARGGRAAGVADEAQGWPRDGHADGERGRRRRQRAEDDRRGGCPRGESSGEGCETRRREERWARGDGHQRGQDAGEEGEGSLRGDRDREESRVGQDRRRGAERGGTRRGPTGGLGSGCVSPESSFMHIRRGPNPDITD